MNWCEEGSYVAVVSRPRTKVPCPSSVWAYVPITYGSRLQGRDTTATHCLHVIRKCNQHHQHVVQGGTRPLYCCCDMWKQLLLRSTKVWASLEYSSAILTSRRWEGGSHRACCSSLPCPISAGIHICVTQGWNQPPGAYLGAVRLAGSAADMRKYTTCSAHR